jgi:hypothetical protein
VIGELGLMTRTMHDSFTKEWMEGLLTDFGTVEIEKQERFARLICTFVQIQMRSMN